MRLACGAGEAGLGGRGPRHSLAAPAATPQHATPRATSHRERERRSPNVDEVLAAFYPFVRQEMASEGEGSFCNRRELIIKSTLLV